MAKIVFDLDTKEFSVVESQEEFGLKDFGKDHKTALINAGTSIVGSGAGAYLARRRAIAKAKAAGATDAEAKAAGRKAALKGAVVGGAAGLAVGVGSQAGYKGHQYAKNLVNDDQSDLSKASYLKRLRKGIGTAVNEDYRYPAKRRYESIKNSVSNLFQKKDKKK